VRLFCLTFLGEYRGHGHAHGHHHAEDHEGHGHGGGHGAHPADHGIHESPWLMTIPLIVLAFLAAFGGYLGMPHWLFHAPNLFDNWLEPVFEGVGGLKFLDNTALELGLMAVSVGLAALSGFTAYRFYAGASRHVPEKLAAQFAGVHRVLLNKYYVDELYKKAIVEPTKSFARFCWRVIDDGLIDGVLVNGTAAVVGMAGRVTRVFTTGDVQRYAAAMFVGLFILVVYWLAG
jgi:NADH-quinone oxidoreductase subunit L